MAIVTPKQKKKKLQIINDAVKYEIEYCDLLISLGKKGLPINTLPALIYETFNARIVTMTNIYGFLKKHKEFRKAKEVYQSFLAIYIVQFQVKPVVLKSGKLTKTKSGELIPDTKKLWFKEEQRKVTIQNIESMNILNSTQIGVKDQTIKEVDVSDITKDIQPTKKNVELWNKQAVFDESSRKKTIDEVLRKLDEDNEHDF